MTYNQAMQQLPADAVWSCSFGFPGEDNYSEFWRTPSGSRFEVSRRDHYEVEGWSVEAR